MSAPAAVAAPAIRAGLDEVFYSDPERFQHVHTWVKTAAYSTTYINHKINDAFAGSAEAEVMIDDTMDMMYTAYIRAHRPGIKGVYSDHPTVPYPCVNRSKREAADRRAALDYVEETQDDDIDDHLSERERVIKGVSSYMRDIEGCTGVRSRLPCEGRPSRSRRDAAHQETESAGAGVNGGDCASVYSAATRRTVNTVNPRRQKHYAFYIPDWLRRYIANTVYYSESQQLDSMSYGFTRIYADINVSQDKRTGVEEMTERPPDFRSEKDEIAYMIDLSSRDREVWLPLYFDHCQYVDKAINMGASIFVHPKYKFTLAPLTKIIRRSDKFTKVVKADGTALDDKDIKLRFVANFISLDPVEAALITGNTDDRFRYDVLTVYHQERTIRSQKDQTLPTEINFKWNGPTISIHWTIQRKVCIDDNEPYNTWGLFGKDPMESCRITCASRTWQNTMPALFYRVVLPLEKAGMAPRDCSYHWAPGHKMFTRQPDCSLNAVKFNKMTAHLEYQKGLHKEAVEIKIYRRAWCLHRYEQNVILPYYHIKSKKRTE